MPLPKPNLSKNSSHGTPYRIGFKKIPHLHHHKTYNFSTGVYLPGLDECNIAQAANGSLFLISRNCREGNLRNCQMQSDLAGRQSPAEGLRGAGVGNHHFVYSISDDGGSDSAPSVATLFTVDFG